MQAVLPDLALGSPSDPAARKRHLQTRHGLESPQVPTRLPMKVERVIGVTGYWCQFFFVERVIGVSSFFVEKRTDTNNVPLKKDLTPIMFWSAILF